MTKPRICCKDCEKRTPSCHCACEDYAEYKKELAEFNEAVKKNREQERIMHEYDYQNIPKRRWMK